MLIMLIVFIDSTLFGVFVILRDVIERLIVVAVTTRLFKF